MPAFFAMGLAVRWLSPLSMTSFVMPARCSAAMASGALARMASTAHGSPIVRSYGPYDPSRTRYRIRSWPSSIIMLT